MCVCVCLENNNSLNMFEGEKLSAEEVEDLLVGQEDAQGNVNYEGMIIFESLLLFCYDTFWTIKQTIPLYIYFFRICEEHLQRVNIRVREDKISA